MLYLTSKSSRAHAPFQITAIESKKRKKINWRINEQV